MGSRAWNADRRRLRYGGSCENLINLLLQHKRELLKIYLYCVKRILEIPNYYKNRNYTPVFLIFAHDTQAVFNRAYRVARYRDRKLLCFQKPAARLPG